MVFGQKMWNCVELTLLISAYDVKQNFRNLKTSYGFKLSLKLWSTTEPKLKWLRLAFTNTLINIHCCYQVIIFNVLPKNSSVINSIYTGHQVFSFYTNEIAKNFKEIYTSSNTKYSFYLEASEAILLNMQVRVKQHNNVSPNS